MKTLIALAGSFVVAGSASAALTDMYFSEVDNGNPDYVTYRVLASFDNTTDKIQAFAGLAGQPLYWQTDVASGIYNDDGDFGTGHIQDIPFGNGTNLDIDTWMTLGQVGGFDFSGVAFSPDFLGIPGGEDLQVLTDGLTSFSDEDSAVFIPGAAKVVTTWGDNEVPIEVALAQFTVASSAASQVYMEFGAVIQWQDESGNNIQDYYTAVVPAPGALALLGLAGLIGRRRR
ncbi:MAG: hypothetical protein SYC29_18510 [Planctomycetota bacterium]|nr:hypothetical protein [Planctomycetota bacterium]